MFPSWQVVIRAATDGKPEVALHVGQLLNALVQFFSVAIAIFVVVKIMNHATRRQKPPPPPPGPELELLKEIRDLLKQQAEPPKP